MNLKEKLQLTEASYRANNERTGRWSAFDEQSNRALSLHGTSTEADRARPSSRQVVRFEGEIT